MLSEMRRPLGEESAVAVLFEASRGISEEDALDCAIGVPRSRAWGCVAAGGAIAPPDPTSVPVGMAKTGQMTGTMAEAQARLFIGFAEPVPLPRRMVYG